MEHESQTDGSPSIDISCTVYDLNTFPIHQVEPQRFALAERVKDGVELYTQEGWLWTDSPMEVSA